MHHRPAELFRAGELSPGVLPRLRAVVLLAGSMRSSLLKVATGRNVLDLPVSPIESLLDQWRLMLGDVAEDLGRDMLPVRVMIERGATPPRPARGVVAVAMSIEEDPGDFRGTGGLLSDLARDYTDDDYLLVASGAQLLMRDLRPEVRRLAAVPADVTLLATALGEPAGLMMVRCGALRGIKRKGFIDLKEQALPQIAEAHDVRVVRTDTPIGRPIRTLDDYVLGLRDYVRQSRGMAVEDPWLAEDWRSTFALVELGAEVDDSAVVHDSVVLSGAVIGAGAVVVRSVVSGGAVVQAGRPVVEEVLGTTATASLRPNTKPLRRRRQR